MKALHLLLMVFVCHLVFAMPSYGATTVPEAMVLTTMTEASVSAFSLLREREAGPIEDFNWSAEYSESDWIYRARGKYNGKDLNFTITGFLWGKDKEDRVAYFNGLGRFGDEALSIHGLATWIYDRQKADYLEMDFKQNLKLGKNSVWGWILGAEIIIGGTIGAATVVVGTIGTAGLGAGAAAILGTAAFGGGAAAMISASSGAQSLLASKSPPSPPEAPKRPEPPKEGQILMARKGMIYTAVSGNGRIACSDLTGTVILSGEYKGGIAQGRTMSLKK